MATYIDAEEYLKRICEDEYQMDRQSNKPITAMIAKNVFMLVRDELRGMPTADVREVKHGHWIVLGKRVRGGNEGICSECGNVILIKHPKLDLFCRYCGAIMDEVVE